MARIVWRSPDTEQGCLVRDYKQTHIYRGMREGVIILELELENIIVTGQTPGRETRYSEHSPPPRLLDHINSIKLWTRPSLVEISHQSSQSSRVCIVWLRSKLGSSDNRRCSILGRLRAMWQSVYDVRVVELPLLHQSTDQDLVIDIRRLGVQGMTISLMAFSMIETDSPGRIRTSSIKRRADKMFAASLRAWDSVNNQRQDE